MNLAQIGTITPPSSIPIVPEGGEAGFVASFVSTGLQLLVIVAFIVALLFTIFAGFRFIFAGSDEKNVAAAWTQIYMGLLGMIVVLGAFAIMRLVETFFGVTIISGTFLLPSR